MSPGAVWDFARRQPDPKSESFKMYHPSGYGLGDVVGWGTTGLVVLDKSSNTVVKVPFDHNEIAFCACRENATCTKCSYDVAAIRGCRLTMASSSRSSVWNTLLFTTCGRTLEPATPVLRSGYAGPFRSHRPSDLSTTPASSTET